MLILPVDPHPAPQAAALSEDEGGGLGGEVRV